MPVTSGSLALVEAQLAPTKDPVQVQVPSVEQTPFPLQVTAASQLILQEDPKYPVLQELQLEPV
jgi:hypothetical protein